MGGKPCYWSFTSLKRRGGGSGIAPGKNRTYLLFGLDGKLGRSKGDALKREENFCGKTGVVVTNCPVTYTSLFVRESRKKRKRHI